MASSNRKQAFIPPSAELIDNLVGTACGFALQLNHCLLYFTPGVLSEFKVMGEREIVPHLRDRFDLPDPPLCLRMTTFGHGESDLANELAVCRCRKTSCLATAPRCRLSNST